MKEGLVHGEYGASRRNGADPTTSTCRTYERQETANASKAHFTRGVQLTYETKR
jgi:hypothetical protein